jgi:hypothetical protein
MHDPCTTGATPATTPPNQGGTVLKIAVAQHQRLLDPAICRAARSVSRAKAHNRLSHCPQRKLPVGLDAQRVLLFTLGIVMTQQRHPPGEPMTLGDMRQLGVQWSKVIAKLRLRMVRDRALAGLAFHELGGNQWMRKSQ